MTDQPTDFRCNPFLKEAFVKGIGEVRHPAERASWIWIDDRQTTRFLKFSLSFAVSASETLRFHVSADQRFQLQLDGQDITYGPDRSDLTHWNVTTCEVPLCKGAHRIEARVWWIQGTPATIRSGVADLAKPPINPPMAQISWRPGFLFAAEGALAEILNTGCGDWQVEDLTAAVGLARKTGLIYHDIGPAFTIDMQRWETPAAPVQPICIMPPDAPGPHGLRRPGWVLAGHKLPEQRRTVFSGGRFRVRRDSLAETPFTAAEEQVTELPFHVPAKTEVTLIWDFGRYVCGYPQLAWSGGAGASIEAEWAESLYEGAHSSKVTAAAPKGHRDEVAGKVWLGFGDTFLCSGADNETSPGLWWRSGCYIRLRIRTADKPLTLTRAALLTTEYPFEISSRWESSDKSWDALFPLLHRGLELAAHETWVDCPYYEQMMYVGDTRLHCLSNFTCYADDRLSRDAVVQFDNSRSGSPEGAVAERYPSDWRQDSGTYALMWPWMVRDYFFWRGDVEFTRKSLAGVRAMLERFLLMRRGNGLIGQVPGWPFIDWVHGWHEGCGPGVREGDSSIVNLHLVMALQAAAELEAGLGEDILAARWKTLAQQTMDALLERYWDKEKNLLLDTSDSELLSEHAQVLALVTGLLDEEKTAACVAALTSGICTIKCSIYFSFYLLEAFALSGQSQAFFDKLTFWRELPALGFKSLPEAPEPTRSDCHGWGAHPLYHSYASIAGIRPAAPGFKRVRIAPMPGPLSEISLTMPHPEGELAFNFQTLEKGVRFEIALPAGVSGELVWNGNSYSLEGKKTLEI